MPRVFYEDEITQDEFNVSMLTDDELTQLMNKYKEKLQRYTIFLNEEFERTERKILIIHLEQVKRFNRWFHLNEGK
jgi:hypothetical protein